MVKGILTVDVLAALRAQDRFLFLLQQVDVFELAILVQNATVVALVASDALVLSERLSADRASTQQLRVDLVLGKILSNLGRCQACVP